LEITPAAAREVKELARAAGAARWWLRVEMTPHGCCTGLKHNLWVELDPPGPEDFEFRVGDITCILLKKQRHLAQGLRIDYGMKGGQTGFIVTSPKATAETRAALAKWVRDELGQELPPEGDTTPTQPK
jgi:Fe-S cluster assembly iron-binding protein IscA